MSDPHPIVKGLLLDAASAFQENKRVYGEAKANQMREASARNIDAVAKLIDSAAHAASFISGFEDDETQEGVGDLLTGLRDAVQGVPTT